MKAVLANENWNARKATGDLQRLVSKVSGVSFTVNPQKSFAFPAITPGQDSPAGLFPLVHQQLKQFLEVRRLACSANGNIAQNDSGKGACLCLQEATVKCEVSALNANFEQHSHGGPPPTVLEDVAWLCTFVKGMRHGVGP